MFNFSLRLPDKVYRKIIDLIPILCVDAVIIHEGKYLLVKRKNEPLKDEWWVPGGRVYKGETIRQAVRRKVREELGISIKSILSIGYYEEHFESSEFGDSGIHTVSIVFICSPKDLKIKLDNQASDWKLSDNLPDKFIIKPF